MIFILFVDYEKNQLQCLIFSKENVQLQILQIPENVDVPIPENADGPISQTQFQRIDFDSLDYDPGTCKQI